MFGVSIIAGLLEVIDCFFFVGLNLYINMYIYSAYIDIFHINMDMIYIHENIHEYHIYSYVYIYILMWMYVFYVLIHLHT